MEFTVYNKKTGEIAIICSCPNDDVNNNYNQDSQDYVSGFFDGTLGYIDVKKKEFILFPDKPSGNCKWSYDLKKWVYNNQEYIDFICSQINALAGNKITLKYPIYLQLNTARTPDADAMYAWIDSIRSLANEYRSKIVVLTDANDIDLAFNEYKVKLDSIQ